VIKPEEPTLAVATANAAVPPTPGISMIPLFVAVATRAMISGVCVTDAESDKVFRPKLLAAGVALVHVKLNATSVGAKIDCGVIVSKKLCAAPGAIVTGVLTVPLSELVAASVVWNEKLAGMGVVGATVQLTAVVVALALIIVPKNVASVLTCTDRLVGSRADTNVISEILAAKVALTVVAWAIVTTQAPTPLHPPPFQPVNVESAAEEAVMLTTV
jgi:hypothetical protein